MNSKEQNKSDFIGFLDGYKAKNIASIKPSLLNNLEEIDYNLDLLINYLSKEGIDEKLKNSLSRSRVKLNSDKEELERAYIFGESLASNFSLFEYANEKKDDVFTLLKRIVYNFVEFAKKSEDNRIIDLAKRVAKNLSI